MPHFFSRAVFCTLFFTLLSAPLFAPVSTPAAAQAAADDAALLHGISRYFTSIPAFTARFSQINPSGDLVRGVMHYQRPGQIAFIYDPPNQLRVVVDATHIHVQENARATPDSYAIDATPLPLFFAPDLDLHRSGMVANITRTPSTTEILLQDPRGNIPGQLYMSFNADPMALRGWRVIDAQGRIITLLLHNVQILDAIAPQHFSLNRR